MVGYKYWAVTITGIKLFDGHFILADKNLLHIFGEFATGIIGIEKLIFSSRTRVQCQWLSFYQFDMDKHSTSIGNTFQCTSKVS